MWYDSYPLNMKSSDIEHWVGEVKSFPWPGGVHNLQRRLKNISNFELRPQIQKVSVDATSRRKKK